MSRIFGPHDKCIKGVLKDLSLKYPEKKYFLDLGCGRGDRTICFEGFDRILYGVDCVDQLPAHVRDRLNFIQDDFVLHKLRFPDHFFDMIHNFDVIEHLPQPELLLQEAHRILKKDGIFILSTPNRNRLLGFLLISLGIRTFPNGAMDKRGNPLEPYGLHLREYTEGEIVNLLQRCGFRVIKSHRIFYGITGCYGFTRFFNWPLFHHIILECAKV